MSTLLAYTEEDTHTHTLCLPAELLCVNVRLHAILYKCMHGTTQVLYLYVYVLCAGVHILSHSGARDV